MSWPDLRAPRVAGFAWSSATVRGRFATRTPHGASVKDVAHPVYGVIATFSTPSRWFANSS